MIKILFGQLLWGLGEVRVFPSCGVHSRTDVYILKIRMKVKKLELWCRVN
jgi:hypothetical protein